MTAPRGNAPGLEPEALAKTQPSETQITSDLPRRRSLREAEALIQELRSQLAAYDRGEVEFDVFACTADVLIGQMADIALKGWAA